MAKIDRSEAEVAMLEAALVEAKARHRKLIADTELAENGIRFLLRALCQSGRVTA